MTSVPDSFPDQISHVQLQNLIREAQTDASTKATTDESITPEQIESICEDILQRINDKAVNHVVPKVIVLQLIKTLADWAESNHHSAKEANDIETASQFYSMANQLNMTGRNFQDIYMGPEDFTHSSNQS